MAFSSKDDAVNNMNSNITDASEPHLTPVGTVNRIRATNLKNWLNEFMDWLFPTTGTALKGKSPVVTGGGTNYTSISWLEIVPVGTIMCWSGASGTPPEGYLFCDGSSQPNSTYPELSALLGTNYGTGTSASQFRLPNLSGRVPLGFETASSSTPDNIGNDPTISNYGKIGNKGGVKNVALKTNELAKHRHDSGSYEASGGSRAKHVHTVKGKTMYYSGGGGVIEALTYAGTQPDGNAKTGNPKNNPDGDHDHDVAGNSGYQGNGTAHENRMPYIVLKYIIKY
jgi:microcystin-dependent protein